jgi:hypothetical protein
MSPVDGGVSELERARREVQALRQEAREVAAQLERARRRAAQSLALAAEESGVEDRMAHLEEVLDLAALTAHASAAIARAPLAAGPVPCALADDLLPPAIRQAAIDAIPASVFAGDGAAADEIPLPPKLAPTFAVATWMFLNDVARDVVGPALAARVPWSGDRPSEPELKLSRSRLLRARADSVSAEPTSQPGEVIAVRVRLTSDDHWDVTFKWGDAPSRKRRRHGDLSSWASPQERPPLP